MGFAFEQGAAGTLVPSVVPAETLLCPWPDRLWTVLYTRSRAEKALAREAAELGIPHFLPLVRPRASRSAIELPSRVLFPGYLFAALGGDDPGTLKRTRHVAGILTVADQSALLVELASVRQALESGLLCEICPSLSVGLRVRVVRGILKGLEGRIDRRRRDGLLTIGIDTIRLALRVQIGEGLVEPIENCP